MKPKVSINLCCYNGENYVREALKGIVGQTYKDWELVFINDGSTDATESVVFKFKEQGYPIIYHYQENKGLGASRNEALRHSQGEYIAFLDHDDVWFPRKLEKQVSVIESNPDIDFIYTNCYKKMGNSNKKFLEFKKRQPEGHVFRSFLQYYPVVLATSMVRAKVLQELDPLFDDKLGLCEEYDVFMRILYKSKAAYIEEPLAIYRVHQEMSSIKFIENYPKEHEHVIEKLKQMEPLLEEKFKSELGFLRAKIGYWHARAKMASGDKYKAREYLKPYKTVNYKFFAFYLSTYFPSTFWRIIDYLGNRASIRFD